MENPSFPACRDAGDRATTAEEGAQIQVSLEMKRAVLPT